MYDLLPLVLFPLCQLDSSMAAVRGEDLITDGWFMEKNEQWPGQAFSLKVEEVIVSTRSKFQDILIFRK